MLEICERCRKLSTPWFCIGDNKRICDNCYYKHNVEDRLGQATTAFYSRLSKGQECLDTELKKIIHRNLWDLYETTK